MLIPPSPTLPRRPDRAAPGRLRRLLLTLAGPPLLLVVPMVAIALYGERLPGRVHVQGWVVDTRHAATWQDWFAQPLWGVVVWFEVLFVISFLCYWHLPSAQRSLVISSFVVGVAVPVSGALWLMELAGTPGTVIRPAWHLVVEVVATAGAAVLGWMAAGRLPSPPVVTAAPPPDAPTMELGPAQRAMFVTSTWSVRRLLVAAVLAAFAVLSVSNGSGAWQGTVLLALWAVFEAAQARTHLQIDGSGVTVRVPWLPSLHRTVPYQVVRFAEARSEAPAGRYRLDDGRVGWGVIGGKGPVLVLSLSDDRWFVYSTREAETAAALVNGWLSRERREGTA
ncbi:hypothetical protein [Streptosporangium sp. NPDC002721]|uniref:hypothetical protein n=1 Tax=Streptosporangium sp. NPDC002721 TaxID=3366188 RepID=UPI00369BC41B